MPETEAYRLVSDALSRQDDITRYDGPPPRKGQEAR
jgi:hypothetical protein